MHIKFAREIIRGRIAEVIFEQMFKEEGSSTVIPFGYESTMPVMAQLRNAKTPQRIKSLVKGAPDFALIGPGGRGVFLVEVKYRSTYSKSEIKKIAQRQLKNWSPSFLFIATPQGFYLSSCSEIVSRGGEIAPLPTNLISQELQEKYLKLLKEFEGGQK
ncbi:hypothetical protein D6821_02755 [Candidatus Parcubacteria bacterium]|nr:MAG: hypothetical protein D6821_02755 [Candidatus Parcubacteria bacterium]